MQYTKRSYSTHRTLERGLDDGAYSARFVFTACIHPHRSTPPSTPSTRPALTNIGDTINLITPNISSNPLPISSKCASSFLILHPDLMLTMTSIANAMPCPRRPILNSLIKTSGAQSKAVVYGNLLHGLLQSSLQERDFTPDGTQARLEGMLKLEEVRLDVWGAGLNVRDVSMELGNRARADFERFGGKWVGPKPTVRFLFG